MNVFTSASREGATLEAAPTLFAEGDGIRFAYRLVGSAATGTPLVLLQHFSGNIDVRDPAVINALAADRPVMDPTSSTPTKEDNL
jgi:hypothetical protein